MGNKLDKVFWIVATIIVVIIAGWLAYNGGHSVGESSTRTSSAILPIFAVEEMQ
ncbi:hypothetical protein [Alteriqipengyuania sp.]|uniref:hypothetical protein n=1 Tax=Alteriqipengyuania sp. TaxID=2800692 RepID=UPI003512A149